MPSAARVPGGLEGQIRMAPDFDDEELISEIEDPFDRSLVAQAQAEGLILVTRDRNIPKYGVRIIAA